jgi:predicted metal-dependent phosphotriesterase family hydrolase
MPLNRRKFIKNVSFAGGAFFCQSTGFSCKSSVSGIMTVNGLIDAGSLGLTLSHEHIMVDFIGADKIVKGRYQQDEVYKTCLPYVQQLQQYKCKAFVDCTPAWLGRDVTILKQLSQSTGIHFITNTGYYGAAGEKFLPSTIKHSTPEQIAAIWIKESTKGIDDTAIKPGFMKLGLDNIPFTENILKILRAAAITHHSTGLPIAVHTSNGGKPAMEQIRLFKSWGVDVEAWIWVHAQIEKDNSYHIEAAQKGAWISFDGIDENNIKENVTHLNALKSKNLLHKVLVSQDAGWYNVGDMNGGKIRGYTTLFTAFIPALRAEGYSEEDIQLLMVKNPSMAFRIRKD